MILVDNRVGSKELLPYIRAAKCTAELTQLQFGDCAFEGNGPNGRIMVGVERKALGDMLSCIEDSRYAAYQRPGMLSMYNKSILMVEGVWKPDTATGYLMECISSLTWRPYRHRGGRMTAYNKLFRYLLTIQLSGVVVITSRDLEQTAYNVCECSHYFNKKWDDHTSLLEMQKLNLPDLNGRASLVRKWAADIDGIGVKHSSFAEKLFKTPYDLARSDETQWLTIPGIGVKLAQSIVKQIHGKS